MAPPHQAGDRRWEMQGPPATTTLLNGRTYLYFAGTGYLGLQGHPELIRAACDAADRFGVHTATSREGFGTSPPVREVERRFSEFLSADAACYLASGYVLSFALAGSISTDIELALVDECAHDSLRESVRWLDGLKETPLPFRHRDAGHVLELLRAHMRAGWRAVVMTDGVFPASGKLAPLADYLSALDDYPGSMLLVDDAHGLAVLGECGRGVLELARVEPARINRLSAESDGRAIALHSATLSKAVGGHGGGIAGSRGFVDRLKRSGGWFRAASAPAAPVAAATAKGLEIVAENPQLRNQLAENVHRLRSGLQGLGLEVESLPTPIVALALESVDAMQATQRKLLDEGIAIALVRDYAGAGPLGMLRIAVFATHTEKMINRLIDGLRRAV